LFPSYGGARPPKGTSPRFARSATIKRSTFFPWNGKLIFRTPFQGKELVKTHEFSPLFLLTGKERLGWGKRYTGGETMPEEYKVKCSEFATAIIVNL
jgi:hypothetical protein